MTTRAGVTLLGVRHAASPAGGDTPGVRFQLAPGILVPARHDGYRRSLAASASGPVPGAGREHIRESCGPSSEAVLPELAEGARLRRFRVRPSSVTATSRSSRQARNRRADHLVGIEHRPTVASPRRVAFAAWTTELEHLAELSAARRTRTSGGPCHRRSPIESRGGHLRPPTRSRAWSRGARARIRALFSARDPAEPEPARRSQPGSSRPRGRLRRPLYVAAGALFLLGQERRSSASSPALSLMSTGYPLDIRFCRRSRGPLRR